MAIPCVAEPEEITRLVLFVASDEASFSIGSEFIVDGGVRWDPCRSMNAPTRPWPASFRITSCHPCGTSVTLGPISTWRTAGAMGEHVGVVGANRLPEVAGPAWGPSACQRAPRAAGRLISGATVPWTMHELQRSSATERLPNLTQDPVAGLAGSGPLWGVAR